MIVFISGPITGRGDYKEKFKAAEDRLRAAGYDYISPRALADLVSDPGLLCHSDYMNLAFDLLSKADAVMQLPGWQESPGACMEYGYARAMEMLILDYTSMVWPEVKNEDRAD